jgi:hypothetical protein
MTVLIHSRNNPLCHRTTAVAQVGHSWGVEYPHELECGLPGFEAVDQPLARAEYHRVT